VSTLQFVIANRQRLLAHACAGDCKPLFREKYIALVLRSPAKRIRSAIANIVRSRLDDWNMVIVVPEAGNCRIDRKPHAIDLPEWSSLRASVPWVKTQVLAGIQLLCRVDSALPRNVV
jgi:hypothetical protein